MILNNKILKNTEEILYFIEKIETYNIFYIKIL